MVSTTNIMYTITCALANLSLPSNRSPDQAGVLVLRCHETSLHNGCLINHSVTLNIKFHKPLFVRVKWRLGFWQCMILQLERNYSRTPPDNQSFY